MRLSAAACAAACWLLVWATSAHAVDWTLTPGDLQGQYHGALWRDRIEETSLDVDARVAGVWGLGAGLSRTHIVYQYGIPDYQQDARLLYGDLTYPLARGTGVLTGYLGIQQLLDSDHGDAGDGMRALAPQLSYSSLDATRYLDLGYAESHYANSSVEPSGTSVDADNRVGGATRARLDPAAWLFHSLSGSGVHSRVSTHGRCRF
jgi:hypothetical protein